MNRPSPFDFGSRDGLRCPEYIEALEAFVDWLELRETQARSVIGAALELYVRRQENEAGEVQYWMVTPSSYARLVDALLACEEETTDE